MGQRRDGCGIRVEATSLVQQVGFISSDKVRQRAGIDGWGYIDIRYAR